MDCARARQSLRETTGGLGYGASLLLAQMPLRVREREQRPSARALDSSGLSSSLP